MDTTKYTNGRSKIITEANIKNAVDIKYNLLNYLPISSIYLIIDNS